MGFPVAQGQRTCPPVQEVRVQSLRQEDPPEKEMATQYSSPVFYLGHPMARGAWWATVHRVSKSRLHTCKDSGEGGSKAPRTMPTPWSCRVSPGLPSSRFLFHGRK